MSAHLSPQARAARRLSWFILFVIGVALTVTLYFVKTQAQSARAEVRALERSLAQEAAAIRVLEAELAYLENPARLSDLNAQHLGLVPVQPEQIKTIEDVALLFPLTEVSAVEGVTP